MENNVLYELFGNLEESLKNNMKIRSKHNLEDGKYREFLIRELLRKIIPSKYEITNGFIIDSNNNISQEMDIIIYDKSYVPPFFEETYSIIPIEAVIAVIQVKTTLDKKQLINAKENLNSIDSLEAKIGGSIVSASNGQLLEEKRYIAPYKIIIAFSSTLKKNTNFCKEVEGEYLDIIYIINNDYPLIIKKREVPEGVVNLNKENLLQSRNDGVIKCIKNNKLCNFSLDLLDKMKLINNSIIINYKEYIKEE